MPLSLNAATTQQHKTDRQSLPAKKYTGLK
jgi:hypothetical protein